MPEHFTVYAQTYDALPEEQMRRLARDADFDIGRDDEGGRTFTYRWPDVTVTCHEMPPQKVPQHLRDFASWVTILYDRKPDERGRQILDRIHYTRLVVGVVIEPQRDDAGRVEAILGAMAHGLNALLFYDNALYDKDARLILALDRSFDESADVLGPVADLIRGRMMVDLPQGEPYQATPAQAARYERVRAELERRKVPTLSYALHLDDAAVKLREPAEVARRVLVLSAVTLLADGSPRAQALELIESRGLWDAVSPVERAFLEGDADDPDAARKLLWRLEDLWVLLWALGDYEELGWPGGMCDVPRLSERLHEHEADPDFVAKAALRPREEILDVAQLTMLIHWAVRDAWIHKRQVPEDLDWAGGANMVPVTHCPAVGVVEERHHALNWLIRFEDADWDDVQTPT